MQPTQTSNTSSCPNCAMDPWKKRMFRMATDSKFHDISFMVGSGTKLKKIGCNRALLSIHCPVFEAMFESSMLESSSNCVKIPDVEPTVFCSMLQWMSTNTLNIMSITHFDALIKLADKYQIKGLMDSCCLFLRHNTITIHVIIDSILCEYHGVDLGLKNLKQMSIRLRILSYSTINDVINAIAKKMSWNNKCVQLWRVSNRKNGTTRPNRYLSPMILSNKQCKDNKKKQEDEDDDHVDDGSDDMDDEDMNLNQQSMDFDEEDYDNQLQSNGPHLFDVSNMKCNGCHNSVKLNNKNKKKHSKKMIDWQQYSGHTPSKAIYARLCDQQQQQKKNESDIQQQQMGGDDDMKSVDAGSNGKHFNNQILLFLKYYDIYHQYLSVVGSILIDRNGLVSEICEAIRKIARWSDEHEVLLWEEEDFQTNKINAIDLQQSVAEAALVDGDIIVFQENSNIFTSLKLKNAKQFLSEYPRCDRRNDPRGANKGNYRSGTMSGGGRGRRTSSIIGQGNNILHGHHVNVVHDDNYL